MRKALSGQPLTFHVYPSHNKRSLCSHIQQQCRLLHLSSSMVLPFPLFFPLDYFVHWFWFIRGRFCSEQKNTKGNMANMKIKGWVKERNRRLTVVDGWWKKSNDGERKKSKVSRCGWVKKQTEGVAEVTGCWVWIDEDWSTRMSKSLAIMLVCALHFFEFKICFFVFNYFLNQSSSLLFLSSTSINLSFVILIPLYVFMNVVLRVIGETTE